MLWPVYPLHLLSPLPANTHTYTHANAFTVFRCQLDSRVFFVSSKETLQRRVGEDVPQVTDADKRALVGGHLTWANNATARDRRVQWVPACSAVTPAAHGCPHSRTFGLWHAGAHAVAFLGCAFFFVCVCVCSVLGVLVLFFFFFFFFSNAVDHRSFSMFEEEFALATSRHAIDTRFSTKVAEALKVLHRTPAGTRHTTSQPQLLLPCLLPFAFCSTPLSVFPYPAPLLLLLLLLSFLPRPRRCADCVRVRGVPARTRRCSRGKRTAPTRRPPGGPGETCRHSAQVMPRGLEPTLFCFCVYVCLSVCLHMCLCISLCLSLSLSLSLSLCAQTC